MLTEKEITRIGKFLSLVLRHQPDTIGITLDQHGWADVGELLTKVNDYGIKLDHQLLNHIVETNAKKRYAFNHTRDKIRASQGHSIAVDLGYKAQQPPEVLYHGTAENSAPAIVQTGIEKRNRQHVHLSFDIETAIKVGQRHGKPFVFKVLAKQMYADGFQFYISDNGVWLTDNVPPKYLTRNEE